MSKYPYFDPENPIDPSVVEAFLQDESLTDESQAGQLMILNEKLDAKLLATFVQVLQKHQAHSVYLPGAVDNCGTGGSGLPRLNTSTLSAFVLSALGVKVAKHGNKAASGRFGSFDLLESLDIEIHQKAEHLQYLYYKTGLAFLFARDHHPIVGRFTKARKLVGSPTIFNYLGPLLNPCQTDFQVIGVPHEKTQQLIAQAAQKIGKKVAVVRGLEGLDEISVSGETVVLEVDSDISEYTIAPSDFGIPPLPLEAVLVESVEDKVQKARAILSGEVDSPHAHLVVANTAFMLKALGKVQTLKEGVEVSRQALVSGKVRRQYEAYRSLSQNQNILTEIIGYKYRQVAECQYPRTLNPKSPKESFKQALLAPGLSVIAEIKKASPSKGLLYKGDFNPTQIAKQYEAHGASAISVLCDERYFQGSFEYLKAVAEVTDLPLLCKEFIIDASQIDQAKSCGASAILLMASVLDTEKLESLLQYAKAQGLESLVEVHTAEELEEVLKDTSAEIVGMNHRNLNNFTVDLDITTQLVQKLSPEKKRDIVLVAESGIDSEEDIQKLPREVLGILIGEGVVNTPERISLLKGARPFVKICGITDIRQCEVPDIDMIGLNFVPTSKRSITVEAAMQLRKAIGPKIKVVGVFQNQSIALVNHVTKKVDLDYIQLSGREDVDFVKQCHRPVIKGISLRDKTSIEEARMFLPEVDYVLFDSSAPGSGQLGHWDLLQEIDFPFILAGGISPENVREALKYKPIGIDSASGVESHGKKDIDKIKALLQQAKKTI